MGQIMIDGHTACGRKKRFTSYSRFLHVWFGFGYLLYGYQAMQNAILKIKLRCNFYRPSVCLSSVTFMHPTQAIEIFGNVTTPLAIC